MFRVDQGATEVYLQFATSRRSAVRCGETDRGNCHSRRSWRRFLQPHQSANVTDGMEVQYRPTGPGDHRDRPEHGEGHSPAIPRGNLIPLLEDPRLKLPEI